MTQQAPGWYPAPDDYPTQNQGQQRQQRGRQDGINSGAWSVPGPEVAPPLGSPVFLDGVRIAPAWKRCASLLIDLATIAVVANVVSIPMGFATAAALIVSSGYGHSVGKVAMGIMVVRPVRWPGGQTLARPGIIRSFARMIVHCFDLVAFIGMLAAFGSQYRRMPADTMNHVIHVEVASDRRWEALPSAPGQSVNAT